MSVFYQIRPVVSHSEVCLPHKSIVPKTIWDYPKGPQRQVWRELLFVQYNNNKNINLLSAPLALKYLLKFTKVLRYLISPGITKGDCYNDCNFLHATVPMYFNRCKGLNWNILMAR